MRSESGQDHPFSCLRAHMPLPSHASSSSQTHRTARLPSRPRRVKIVRRTSKKDISLPPWPVIPTTLFFPLELCPYLSDAEVRIPVGIQPGEQSKAAAVHSQTCAEPRRSRAVGLISSTHSPGCVLTLRCPHPRSPHSWETRAAVRWGS